tara:strand:- start:7282 stop:8544 length:1263 start_codon:yes stop_codon:yes gene_type:complete
MFKFKEFLKYLKRFKRTISFIGILNAFKHFKSIKKIKPVDVLYLCHDNSRPILLNGIYYSPLIDSINNKLKDYSNITLALPFSKYSGNRTYGNTINLNFYIIVSLLRRIIINGSLSLKNTENDPLIKFYSYLFEKLKLKIIFGIQPSIEMCIAAKINKINIIDIQHGIIDVNQTNSYYSLEKRFHFNDMGWPNYIFCRNRQSLSEVLKLNNYTKPILIGNLNKYFYENVYCNIEEIKLFKTKRKTILFTFQPFYESESFSSKNLHHKIIFPTVLLKLILSSNYNFILKLHPSQIQNKNLFKLHITALNNLFSEYSNVDFIINNNKPLEYSLVNSDLHITYNSASFFDAFDYGLKTILLDDNLLRLNRYFGELMNSSYVIVDPSLEFDFSMYFNQKKEKDYKESSIDFNFKSFISENIIQC